MPSRSCLPFRAFPFVRRDLHRDLLARPLDNAQVVWELTSRQCDNLTETMLYAQMLTAPGPCAHIGTAP